MAQEYEQRAEERPVPADRPEVEARYPAVRPAGQADRIEADRNRETDGRPHPVQQSDDEQARAEGGQKPELDARPSEQLATSSPRGGHAGTGPDTWPSVSHS